MGGKLGRLNICKDFWDSYKEEGKYWPIADRHVPSNDSKNNCILAPVPFESGE